MDFFDHPPDFGGVQSVVIGRRADDAVERGRQNLQHLTHMLVLRATGDEDRLAPAREGAEACERGLDAFRRVAHIDDDERIVRNRFETAGPGDVRNRLAPALRDIGDGP